MKKSFNLKSLSISVAVSAVVLASCNKSDNPLTSSDTQNINSESVSDSYTTETADMSNSIITSITNTQYGNGRVAGGIILVGTFDVLDSRLSGAIVTINPTGTVDAPSGTIVIDFGTGVTINGVTRIGQIIITYSGKKSALGATRVITYSGYSRDGVSFHNGMTYTITNVTDSTAGAGTIQFHHVLNNGTPGSTATLAFPDSTKITRGSDFNVTYNYGGRTLSLSANSNTTYGHSATGTTREGKVYNMDISGTKPLIYKASCVASKVYIPVEGTKTVAITGGANYSVDYGDSIVCDNTVVVSVNGKNVTLTFNNDGN